MKHGGLRVLNPKGISEFESPDCRNEIISGNRLKTRPGMVKVNPTALGSPINFLLNVKSGFCKENYKLAITRDGWIIIDPENFIELPQKAHIVAYWKFEEASGTIKDETGNYDGTYNGALYRQTGKIDYALGFDGLDDEIIISDIGALANFSVAFWLKIDSFTHFKYMGPMGRETIGQSFFTGNGVGGFGLLLSGSPDTRITYPLPLNTWVHVVATHDGTTLKYYINGLKIYEIDNSTTWTLENIRLGTAWAIPGGVPNWYYFDGDIDEFIIWNKYLSAIEISDYLNWSYKY